MTKFHTHTHRKQHSPTRLQLQKQVSDEQHPDQLLRLWVVLALTSPLRHSARLSFENLYVKCRFLLKKTRCVVYPINELRKIYGEFHHLYWQLLKSFRAIFRILENVCVETSHFLKNKLSQWLQKQTKNYRQTISHTERLVVKIRIDFKRILSSLKRPDQLWWNRYWGSFYYGDALFCATMIHKPVYKMFLVFCTAKIPYI